MKLKPTELQQINDLLKVFTLAKSLIEDPNNWTKSWHARTVDGLAINAKDRDAAKFAITGSVFRALFILKYEESSTIYQETIKMLSGSISKYDPDVRVDKMIDWNDRSTHPEVLKVLEKCIDKLSKQIK